MHCKCLSFDSPRMHNWWSQINCKVSQNRRWTLNYSAIPMVIYIYKSGYKSSYLSVDNFVVVTNKIKHYNRICIILEYMTIGHQYLCSKWYTSAPLAMTPLHSGATGGLKSMTPTHYMCMTAGGR